MPSALVSLALLAGSAFAQQQNLWGQCGGIGYSGPTNCVAGSCCSTQNPWYAQCTPGAGCPGNGGSGQTSTAAATTTTKATSVAVTTTSTSSTPAATSSSPAIPAGSLQQVNSFGSNPSNIQMFIYVPNKLANNPPIIVAVSHIVNPP